MLVRIINCFVALLFGGAAVAIIVFLPASIDEFATEPEDVWLLVFWLVFCASLSGLCLFNAMHTGRAVRNRRKLLIALNGLATALLAVLFVLGRSDNAVMAIIALVILGPAAMLLLLVSGKGHKA